MIGCYDFCGHYEWTFGWMERVGGHELVREYWNEAINHDSQRHARALIEREGIAGMRKYWGHTLAEESPDLGFNISFTEDVFRIDFHDCPSRGFLLRNGIRHYHDYCDHCMGWTGPMMGEAGYVVDHEHDHRGHCWWEMRRRDAPPGHNPVGAVAGDKDVRLRPDWPKDPAALHRFDKATDPDAKMK